MRKQPGSLRGCSLPGGSLGGSLPGATPRREIDVDPESVPGEDLLAPVNRARCKRDAAQM